ncbi:MAG: PLP-dependent aminotransferase family protein [Acidobacteriota bacterium]
MLIVAVDKTSGVPVYRQICDRVACLIDAGTLAPGDRLPPTRVMARTAGVHRSSVLRAYGELWALGYLESRPGSYTTIRRRAPPTASVPGNGGSSLDWAAITNPAIRAVRAGSDNLVSQSPTPPNVIDLSRLSADRRLTPIEDVRRSIRMVLADEGRELLDYGDPAGYRPLREAIARHMRVHGVAVEADEVVVTAGAQHALDLVHRLLAAPGARVIVESPTYSAALSLMRLHGVDPVEVPMGPDGMDLDRVAGAMRRAKPAFVYTMPSFQNPTGVTTSHAHRERLLALGESHKVPIVEDGFEEEMKYFGKAALPIKSIDRRGIVIYVGTFSKVVFPGLRLGWIAAPRACIERVVAVARASCLSGNPLAQAVAARFCQSGRYEAHLRRIHTVYRRRMQTMLAGLAGHMPDGVEWTTPTGGYTLWLTVKDRRVSEVALYQRLLGGGVKVSPGRVFFAAPPRGAAFRVSIACVTDEEIAEATRRLGQALARALHE